MFDIIFFSNKIIFDGEIKDANTEQFFIRFPNTDWTLISFEFELEKFIPFTG